MEKTGNRAAGQDGISAGNAGIGNSIQPSGVLECWSVGDVVKFSHPPSHPHVLRPVLRRPCEGGSLGEGGSTTPALRSGQ